MPAQSAPLAQQQQQQQAALQLSKPLTKGQLQRLAASAQAIPAAVAAMVSARQQAVQVQALRAAQAQL